ncbi:D-psicose/D-tagatose/L-ribulose 3-epimerase [Metapseudomonas resinovorans]|uniref:sugar phosphate isomerase/epimerase family protein n=1 Tax=Metapseudomonas resinovorans TaxID=53412 RepID=UPI00237F4201|nr:TIM barrel protein [Pseudomonas resinovorans]MDE3739663.1 TIM barrel protein [Pseudomonas resinovorans]
MKLSFSSIAWDIAEDDAVSDLLACHAVNAIDIVPGKYFPDPPNATLSNIAQVRRWWSARGIEIVGMQALMFGTRGLNLFGSDEMRAKMLRHLAAQCRIASELGTRHLVFGSPQNRDRGALDKHTASCLAADFFFSLGEIADHYGVHVCLEPTPALYSSNFMLNTAETAAVVRNVAHPAISLQLDTGSLTLNGENPFEVLEQNGHLIGHIHASEPGLLPLGDGDTDHQLAAAAIRCYLPGRVVSIEMKATSREPHLASMKRALNVAQFHYRNLREAAQR